MTFGDNTIVQIESDKKSKKVDKVPKPKKTKSTENKPKSLILSPPKTKIKKAQPKSIEVGNILKLKVDSKQLYILEYF